MKTISYLTGTAPASLVVVRGHGRALNPTKRSGRPQETNLSAHTYDNKVARHRSGAYANVVRTDSFDTPVRVFQKNTGWMTVSGGKEKQTVTYAPDAVVVYAEVKRFIVDTVTPSGMEFGHFITETVTNIPLSEYMNTYC